MRTAWNTEDNEGGAAAPLLLAGAILVVAAAAPYRLFDLDRFLAPKEMALHAVALALALFALLAGGWRRAIAAATSGEYMEGLALAATLVVTGIVATFDAVLLLPAPAFICWALFGALAAPAAPRWSPALSPLGRRRLLLGVAIVGAAALLRSAGQVGAMAVYGRARTAAQVTRAHLLDPGNARIGSRYAALKERRR